MGKSIDYGDSGSLREKSRSCTDVVCLLIFIVFIGGLVAITVFGVLDHSLYRLVYGFDSYGNICNRKNKETKFNSSFNGIDLTGRKYVLYFDYSNPKDSTKICVKKCPDVRIRDVTQFKNFTSNNGNLCLYNITQPYDSKHCPPFPIYQTTPVLNRCVPRVDEIIANQTFFSNFIKYLNEAWFQRAIVEIYQQVDKIVYLSLISLALSFILVFLLRYIARLIVILILIASCLGSIALTAFLWYKYYLAVKLNEDVRKKFMFTVEMSSRNMYLTYGILSSVFMVIFLLIVIAMRKSIGLVVKLFAEAQKAIKDVPFLLLMPVLTFLIYFLFLAYWLFSSLMLASFARYGVLETKVDLGFRIYQYKPFIWFYQFVGLVWVSEFIFACEAMVVSGAVSTWYFTSDKEKLSVPILSSLKRLIVYHLGSAAFGSFIITLIKVPRYILMYIQKKVNQTNNEFVKYISKCCICCLWCLEKFMKYINYNAYTIINIEGKSFCPATKKAFSIVLENALSVSAINSVGDFMLFIAKIAVTVLTLVIGIFVLNIPIDTSFQISEIKYQGAPLLIVCVISYLIAHCFFTVYENVIDAIMVCFCVDSKANDGSEERPYFMSKSLRKFIDEAQQTNIQLSKENGKSNGHL